MERTEDADEGDEDLLTSVVVRGDTRSDTSDDEVADDHSERSVKEERTTTGTVDKEKTRNGGTNVDDVRGDGDDEGVGDTRVLEELSTLFGEKSQFWMRWITSRWERCEEAVRSRR